MLWQAGQKRLARESRHRRAELYEAVRDAQLAAEIAVGRAKPKGIPRLPAYLEEERDPDAARRGLRSLVADTDTGGRRGARPLIDRTVASASEMRAAFMAQVRPGDRLH